jgi:hypothetical protein
MTAAELANNFQYCSALPIALFSEPCSHFANKYCNQGCGGAINYIWLTPVSIAGNVLGILLTPLVVSVNLVASILFALIACVSVSDSHREIWFEAAINNASMACMMLTFGIITMAFRILNPNILSDLPPSEETVH